ncbi:MAG: beta-N-acetylhexosaminidase [Sphingobacteriia bacterium]|nr:beta-N-acetylhexosaminidase [Sphingobacteriia bacterium]
MTKYNIVVGLEGKELAEFEKELLTSKPPFGVILFARNLSDKEQVKALISSIKDYAGEDTKIFIDQEGGRVTRLKPPVFSRELKSMEYYSNLYNKNKELGAKLIYLNSYLLGKELLDEFDIDGNFAPVCDLRFEKAHKIIGDRSFGSTPEEVALMSYEMYKGLLQSGVIPCIKHIPGHGRAMEDSHLELPTVETSLIELEQTDFKVFKLLSSKTNFAMTAHVKYTALDEEKPATISKSTIDYIRNNIGFKDIIITDDLAMKALGGSIKEKAEESLNAGCDIIMLCRGTEDDYREFYDVATPISSDLETKINKLEKSISNNTSTISFEDALNEFNQTLLALNDGNTKLASEGWMHEIG